jgi:ArsR family transcriptional regulator
MDPRMLVLQLRALGEPTRLELARLISQREWGAGELLDRVTVSQPSLSRHLKLLREAGIVQERREGRQVYYRMEDNELVARILAIAGLIERSGSKPRHMLESKSISAGTPPRPPAQARPEVKEDRPPRPPSFEEWLN